MNLGVATIPVAQKIAYLRTLPAIRERSSQVFSLAESNGLEYFRYHARLEGRVVDYCVGIIQVISLASLPHLEM